MEVAGLPKRMVAILKRNGFERLGDLERLNTLHPGTLDDEHLALAQRVAAWCRGLETGGPPRLHFGEWLNLFLPPRPVELLRAHYRLTSHATGLVLYRSTLRATGRQLNLSGERVRQLLNQTLHSLRQTIPLQAAERFYRAAEKTLKKFGGVVEAAQLALTKDNAMWGDLAPAGVWLLLNDLMPGRITVAEHYFCLCSHAELDALLSALRRHLEASVTLVSLHDLARELPLPPGMGGRKNTVEALRVLARYLPDSLVTLGDRVGLLPLHGPACLRDIMAGGGDEVSLRQLTAAFNRLVQPECGRGSGTLRVMLDSDPDVRKTAPGRYALRQADD